MSHLWAVPELLASTATDLSDIGSALMTANAATVAPTAGLLPPAADEISAAITSVFADHARVYQVLSRQAAAFHDQFVQTLSAAAGSYAAAEAANASPLQAVVDNVLGVINTPTNALLGRPLIGNGADGTAASPSGGAGGLLVGNGGNGFSATTAEVAGGAGGAGGLFGNGGAGGAGGVAAPASGASTAGVNGGAGGAGGAAGLWDAGGAGGRGGSGGGGYIPPLLGQTIRLSDLALAGGDGGDGGRGGLLYGAGGAAGQGGAGSPGAALVKIPGGGAAAFTFAINNNIATTANVNLLGVGAFSYTPTVVAPLQPGTSASVSVAIPMGSTGGTLNVISSVAGQSGRAGNAGASGLLG
ncbi:PE family protein [Mycobacterium gordonae]|uniref:PE domain-containing protein n=1 Tax=Mycobacterium gordonae TaxID=1778 RepID=A0A1X1X3G1_MYCGO|nr:PE family protein [Mycobacterium gordonae]ORV93319.1 hypothetical protein AWC08_18510 [Mycobacterium gordonae]